MTRRAAPRGDGRGGYILVAVLGTMLLLTAFMAAGSVLVRSALDSVKVGDGDVAMMGLTEGGLEITAYQLFVLKASPELIDGRRIRLTGGIVAPTIADEAAKADLNGSDPKLLQAIFESTGMDSGLASAVVGKIVDLRGPDRDKAAAPTPFASPTPAAFAGQGAAPVLDTPTPQSEHNQLRGFQSLDQLRDFPDLTRSDLRNLSRLLTVYNPDGRINIMTASREVLKAIPGLKGPTLEEILAKREGADKREAETLRSSLGPAADYAKVTPGPAYRVRIEAISTEGRKKTVDAVIAASKSPNDPYYILDWRD